MIVLALRAAVSSRTKLLYCFPLVRKKALDATAGDNGEGA
jgi:hypothetical protein